MSVLLLPLATVFALEFSAPAWALLLAVPVLGERLTASRVGAVVLGLIGVLVILRPGLETFRPETLLVLAAAVGFAVTMITTKKLTMTDSTFAIIIWMNVIQLPLTLIPSDPLFVMKLSLGQLPAFAAVGVAGLASHYCLANAFRAGDASVVVPLDFLRIPLIAVNRLVALRRGAGCPRLRRRRPDHRRRAVEFAERGPAAGHSARRSTGPGGRGPSPRSALAR
jgi:drug/metabolite transporter (DMT)-like permease